jgi:para-nitrobenzyl esterase
LLNKPVEKEMAILQRTALTENGAVRGLTAPDTRIAVYKGIPFAAPPIGENRWRPPQPTADWAGIRDCFDFAPMPIQDPPRGALRNERPGVWNVGADPDADLPMSEDCLYLNVWTPAMDIGEKLPVMVWFFGGGYRAGHTGGKQTNGERIASRGVVYVEVSYRVGALGFLVHTQLADESKANDECLGNYGLLDQVAGLQWLRRNIAAFGGDPSNITIFGVSAGACSVHALSGAPMAGGLFHRAIMQSGGGLRTYCQDLLFMELPQALSIGDIFFEMLGVKTVAEARTVDAHTILEKSKEVGPKIGGIRSWSPVVDGRFLPMDPSDYILENRHPDIPYMFGYAGKEYDNLRTAPFEGLDGLEAYMRHFLGDKTGEFLKLCPVRTNEELKALYTNDDMFKSRSVGNLAYALTQVYFGRRNNYFYRFEPTIPGPDGPGAHHGSEVSFVFETLYHTPRPFNGSHYDLARIMCNYWTNFAKYGNPNGDDIDGTPMPEWREFAAGDPFIAAINEKEIKPLAGIMTDLMRFRLNDVFEKVKQNHAGMQGFEINI